jgi:hypothetical protein
MKAVASSSIGMQRRRRMIQHWREHTLASPPPILLLIPDALISSRELAQPAPRVLHSTSQAILAVNLASRFSSLRPPLSREPHGLQFGFKLSILALFIPGEVSLGFAAFSWLQLWLFEVDFAWSVGRPFCIVLEVLFW